MDNLENILSELEVFLKSINAPILEKLMPGVDRNYLHSLIGGLGLSFTTAVQSLYNWRNGVSDKDRKMIGQMSLFPNGILYPIEESIEVYKYNTEDFMYWEKRYFPLFSSGGGDFLLVDLDSGQLNSVIFIYSPVLLNSNIPVAIFDSLSTLFLSVLECYQQRAYYFENGILEVNHDAESLICRKNNPKSEYWND